MRFEDKLIFNEIKKGNREVYQSLFDSYYEALVGFAENYTFDRQASEDLVQELFIYVWENAAKVEIHTSLKSYFYQSVRNRCLNYLKSLKLEDRKNLLYINALLNTDDDVEFFEPEILDQIRASIDELPEQMATVFRLKLFEGMKQKEIAEELDVSVNTVKTHLKRARVKLRDSLFNRTKLLFLNGERAFMQGFGL